MTHLPSHHGEGRKPKITYKRGYRPRPEPKVSIAPSDMSYATLADRTGCAFPVNNGGPFLFCNAEVGEQSPYCAHHRQRMYTKAERGPHVLRPL